jgi:hypothetical protein
MYKHNQRGFANGLVVGLILAVLLLFVSLGFGYWAFSGRQDYENNVDQKIASAVKIAKQEESTAKDKQFVEDEKKPLKTYNGPSQLGAITVLYPKTWSGYVVQANDNNNSSPLLGYFYPGVVPSVSDTNSRFALKIEIVNSSYSTVMDTINNFLQSNDKVPPSVTPYSLPKVPTTIGVKMVGNLPDDKQGEMIISFESTNSKNIRRIGLFKSRFGK